MALWVCAGDNGCGTKYAVGLFRCPRCHNTEFHEDGDPMAKITRHGGASDKTLPAPTQDAAAAETEPTPEAAADQTETASPADVMFEAGAETTEGLTDGLDVTPWLKTEEEGGEESSPGSSSSASTEKPPTPPEPSSKPTRKPARRTASRTAPARTDSSSAPSTVTGQTAPTSAADDSGEA
jgi:hypothetical protein